MPTPAARPSYSQLHAQLMDADRDRSRILRRYEDRYGIGKRASTVARRDPDYQAAQARYDDIRRQMGPRADRGPATLAARFRF